MGGKWDFNQLVDDNKPLKHYGVGLKTYTCSPGGLWGVMVVISTSHLHEYL